MRSHRMKSGCVLQRSTSFPSRSCVDGLRCRRGILIMALSVWVSYHGCAGDSANAQSMTAQECARLVNGPRSDLRSFTFVYEGEQGTVESILLDGSDPIASDRLQFQGTYAWRADGATLIDFYMHRVDKDVSYSRTTLAAIGGRASEVTRIPDEGHNPKPYTYNIGSAAFSRPMSPDRYLYIKELQALNGRGDEEFKDRGWEDVSGHRCRKVEILTRGTAAKGGGAPLVSATDRLWIDMERGAYPLKVESMRGEDLWMRTVIELKQFPDRDGQLVWLPADGVLDSFIKIDSSISKNPVVREVFHVVSDTVVINPTLPDKMFKVDYKGGLPESPELAAEKMQFQGLPFKAQTQGDSAGVQNLLMERLAEADKQAAGLDASSIIRDWGMIGSISLALVGAGVLAGAWMLQRRGG